MTALILVHSPLIGPSTWHATADSLRLNGFQVHTPSMLLTDPPYHENLARAARVDGPAIAIGHSGAGALLPAISDTAVFVDALLPHPGRSWFDIAPPQARQQLRSMAQDRILPPWNEWFPDLSLPSDFVAEIPRLPLAYFEEPATAAPPIRGAYVRLSEAYDTAADEAERLGWWVRRENSHHLAMLTDPEWVAGLIADCVEHLTRH